MSQEKGFSAVLVEIFEESRQLGFLGPGPVRSHLEHALLYTRFSPPDSARVLDLGSGGGIPGLVLAQRWPGSTWVLLDSSQRRTQFLRLAVQRLDLEDRIAVLEGRAEDLAQDPKYRHTFALVVARSFAKPAVTAECAAGFLAQTGVLLVSEPPDRPAGPETADRWEEKGLLQLGMKQRASFPGIAVFTQEEPCSPRFPRRAGVPQRRPLW